MLKALRILVILASAASFAGAWHVAPNLLEPSGLRWLSGIVAVLWALEVQLWVRLGNVAEVQGLSSREHERLNLRLCTLRKRIWWVGGIGLICSLVLWLMATMNVATQNPLYATLAGLLFGISLSHLILTPVWLNEAQAFVDDMKRRGEIAKRRQEALRAMSSS